MMSRSGRQIWNLVRPLSRGTTSSCDGDLDIPLSRRRHRGRVLGFFPRDVAVTFSALTRIG